MFEEKKMEVKKEKDSKKKEKEEEKTEKKKKEVKGKQTQRVLGTRRSYNLRTSGDLKIKVKSPGPSSQGFSEGPHLSGVHTCTIA